MLVRLIVAAMLGTLLLGGCGRPIPTVRAGAQPDAEVLRVKSVEQAQAEQAHAQNLQHEHVEASEAIRSTATEHEVSPGTQPASRPATEEPRPPADGR